MADRTAVEYVRVEMRTSDGRTSVLEFEPRPGEPVLADIEWSREPIETTWDDPLNIPSYRTFKPGPATGSVAVNGPVARSSSIRVGNGQSPVDSSPEDTDG